MRGRLRYLVAAALIAAFPLLGVNVFYLQLAQQVAFVSIAVLGLNLLIGLSGQLSLGHMGFYAIGGYLVVRGHLSLGAMVAVLAALLVAGRWITEAGFSAMWGAFTFPAAACASALLATGWAVPGVLALAAASGIILPIAVKVMQAWMKGGLAIKTNAAQA